VGSFRVSISITVSLVIRDMLNKFYLRYGPSAVVLESRDWRSPSIRDFEAAWRSPSHNHLLNSRI